MSSETILWEKKRIKVGDAVLPGGPGQDPFPQIWSLKSVGGPEKLGVLRPPFFVKRGLKQSEKAKNWS